MKNRSKYYKLIPAIALFVALPLLLYALGDFPRKSIIKEVLSIVTIIAFCAMLAQFYFTRHNKQFNKGREFSLAVKVHQFLGYFIIAVLFLHPFLIVVPRYFEAGVNPSDAFLKLISEFDSLGVVLGMMAYGLMLFIFVSTYFRKKFDLQYRIGRMFHGYLAVIFVVAASWHVINIGRHSNISFSIYIGLMAIGGIFYLLQTYYKESKKELKHDTFN